MPSVEENKVQWNDRYDWENVGDEWSRSWGGSQMQWFASLLPRIHAFVPAGTILEIAPGFGRWTQFLKGMCAHLILVDLSERCIEACKARFSDCSHIAYHVNDGRSLDMVPDNTIDFAFSFDSLVHAEEDVLLAYVAQLSKKLSRNGAAFIHHSNLGEYPYYQRLSQHPKMRRVLRSLHMIEKNTHWRAFTVTAAKVERFAAANNLRCISQEMIPWGTKRALIDCLSVMVREDSNWSRANVVLRNPAFKLEKQCAARISDLYGMPPR